MKACDGLAGCCVFYPACVCGRAWRLKTRPGVESTGQLGAQAEMPSAHGKSADGTVCSAPHQAGKLDE